MHNTTLPAVGLLCVAEFSEFIFKVFITSNLSKHAITQLSNNYKQLNRNSGFNDTFPIVLITTHLQCNCLDGPEVSL